MASPILGRSPAPSAGSPVRGSRELLVRQQLQLHGRDVRGLVEGPEVRPPVVGRLLQGRPVHGSAFTRPDQVQRGAAVIVGAGLRCGPLGAARGRIGLAAFIKGHRRSLVRSGLDQVRTGGSQFKLPFFCYFCFVVLWVTQTF